MRRVPSARHPAASILLALLLGGTAAPAHAAPVEPRAQELERAGVREIIVRHAAGADAARRAAVRERVRGQLVQRLDLPRTEVVRVPAGELTEALAALYASEEVAYAEVNAPLRAYTNDRFWRYQWGLDNIGQPVGLSAAGQVDADIDAPEAWATTSGEGIVVGVVDTGVDFDHPDLRGQLTGNPGELGAGRETNNLDDDGNGHVDDWRGWDFVPDGAGDDATPGPDNLPEDPEGHGTHVTGTVVAARDNGEGVAGAAPGAKVLPMRVLGADGSGEIADVAAAFDYAGRLGLPVVNASLGGPDASRTLQAAIDAHPKTLFVVAAGNGGEDGVGDDVDTTPEYPCAFDSPNVVCVGASDNGDRAAPFSNFGGISVDLFAPGVDIASTSPLLDLDCDTYCFADGTSMAAPHVAAVAALVAAAQPHARGPALRLALVDGAQPVAGLPPSVTRARLSAPGALAAAARVAAAPVAAPTPSPAAGPATSPDSAPAPIAQPAPAASPSPAVAPAPAASPVRIVRARLSRRVLRGTAAALLTVSTNRSTSVTVTLTRAGARRATTMLRPARKARAVRIVLRRRLAGRRLTRGRYLVRVVARDGRDSATRTLTLRVV